MEFGAGSGVAFAGVMLGVISGFLMLIGLPRSRTGVIGLAVADALAVGLIVSGGGELFAVLYFLCALSLVRVNGMEVAAAGACILVVSYALVSLTLDGLSASERFVPVAVFAVSCVLVCALNGRDQTTKQETRRVGRELEAERGYSGSISSYALNFGSVLEVLDLKRILDWTAVTARDLTSSGFAHVVVLDGNTHATSIEEGVAESPTWWHPALQEVVLRGSRHDGVFSEPEKRAAGVRGFIAAPLDIPGSEHNGTLVLGGKDFDENDERVLLLIAKQASSALASAWESPGGRDFATGLPNRDSLYRTLDEMLSRGAAVTVVCLRFDGVWDGYRVDPESERMLRKIGERLAESHRTYRYKSEELFVVIKSASERRAEKFCGWVGGAVEEISGGGRLDVSTGYVIADPEEYDAMSAVGRARRIARGHEAESRLFPDVPEAADTVVAALLEAAAIRDRGLAEHMKSVRGLARRIGREVGLDKRDMEVLSLGAMLHDIGKIGVPDGVLKKPGKLTSEEFDLIKQHTVMGAGVISQIPHLSHIVPVVRHHHERNDGRGYPDGLAGKNIPLCARIIFVADAYDSMVQDRPYRKGLSHEEAVEEIRRNAGTQFDPEIASIFLEIAPTLRSERFRRASGEIF